MASKTADLVVQTGFNRSTALEGALDRGIPFLVMEEPPFRTLQAGWASFGYNGLAGGAYRPKAPEEPRPTPDIAPLKTSGATLIIGQKPTDLSLRGSDHVEWLEDKLLEYPGADIRHHPLCVAERTTIEEGLRDVKKVIVYTSTVAVDAAVAGCEVVIEGSGCWWRAIGTREEECHELSWAAFTHAELATQRVARYILSGYEEACTIEPELSYRKGEADVRRAICEQYRVRLQ